MSPESVSSFDKVESVHKKNNPIPLSNLLLIRSRKNNISAARHNILHATACASRGGDHRLMFLKRWLTSIIN